MLAGVLQVKWFEILRKKTDFSLTSIAMTARTGSRLFLWGRLKDVTAVRKHLLRDQGGGWGDGIVKLGVLSPSANRCSWVSSLSGLSCIWSHMAVVSLGMTSSCHEIKTIALDYQNDIGKYNIKITWMTLSHGGTASWTTSSSSSCPPSFGANQREAGW